MIEYLQNTELLESGILLEKNNIRNVSYAYSLSSAHISKALHNLKFSQKIGYEFIDWKIVGLYYSVYHSALALLANKGYITKSHTATFLMLIKLFHISLEDVKIIDDLRISKEDAEFYVTLREERNKANYSTNILYDREKFLRLREGTIIFVNKAMALTGR